MLVQHIRNGDKLIGTVVALDKKAIGWSQCGPRDKFNKKRGIEIAKGRALKGTTAKPTEKRKDIISEYVEKMKQRADKYFQEDYDASN